MVVVGNTERAIFDVQAQKHMVSPIPQNVYFHYHMQWILNKDVFLRQQWLKFYKI